MRPMSNVTIIDNDEVTIGFEMETYPATEDQGTVEVCARLMEGTLAREAVITLQTESGSAQAPDDYTSVSVALTFDASTDRQCQDIALTNDDTLEGVEEFEAVLETEEERVALSPDKALVSITDDDCKYGLLFFNVSKFSAHFLIPAAVIGFEETMYSANESDGEIEVFVAVLQGELSGPVVLRISTMDGSAIAGSDYESIDQLLTFDQSTTRIDVSISIREDDIVENLETLHGVLVLESFNSGRAPTIDPEEAQLNIADNDSMLMLSRLVVDREAFWINLHLCYCQIIILKLIVVS
jgi:hypothetical protein